MISPSAKAIRDNLARDVVDDTPLAAKREQWEDSERLVPTPTGVSVQKAEIAGVSCLQCEPAKLNSHKVIVYCHGGGLVAGSAATFRVWTSRLALHMGCRVISIDYRLAPENPYPAAVNDVLAVCKSMVTYNNSDGFCIGADSTGCILALHAMLNLKRANGVYPNSAFLLSPSIDLTFSGASIDANASRDPLVSLAVLKQCAKWYAGNKDLSNPDISPLFAHFNDMPPTLAMVDDSEILLDDARRLVEKITASGGIAKLLVSHGLWHVWPAWGDFPESVAALDDIKQHIFAN